MPSKTKRNAFTIEEKSAIIWRLENGELNSDLSKEFQVPHSTISTIWKNKEKIRNTFESRSLKIKKVRETPHQDVENALLTWFKIQRSRNIPLTGRILQEKANDFANLLGKTNFSCSESWIYRFRQRHSIVTCKVSGEAADVSQGDCNTWLQNVFPKLRDGYQDSEIFNADETGLFFKLMPDKALKLKGEKCIGGKLSKDRITVLVAANMDGSVKRKLLIIGKSKKPRCFKNKQQLLVDYEANKRAWMTSELFEKAIYSWDLELKRSRKKILLLVDNCPAHPQIKNLENIKLAFLPPNTTSVLQPIDQGIIKCLKSHYRKMLVFKTINHMDNNAAPFKVTLPDAIEMVVSAWERVDSRTLKKCFEHAGFYKAQNSIPTEESNSDDELENEPLAHLIQIWRTESLTGGWNDYVNVDNELFVAGEPTDEEIIEREEPTAEISSSIEDNVLDLEDPIPSAREALNAVSTFKRFALFGEGAENLSHECVFKLERELERIYSAKQNFRQVNITDYFKKI